MASAPKTPLTLKVQLSPVARRKLAKQAADAGQALEAFASGVLERAAISPDIEAILAPLRKEFADSGTSDEELVRQINEARDEHHARRRGARRLVKKEIDDPLSIIQAAEPFARAVEASGVSDDEFASIMLQAQDEARKARRSFNEILAPARKAFAKSGATEEELDDAVNEARKAIHAKSRRKSRK